MWCIMTSWKLFAEKTQDRAKSSGSGPEGISLLFVEVATLIHGSHYTGIYTVESPPWEKDFVPYSKVSIAQVFLKPWPIIMIVDKNLTLSVLTATTGILYPLRMCML